MEFKFDNTLWKGIVIQFLNTSKSLIYVNMVINGREMTPIIVELE